MAFLSCFQSVKSILPVVSRAFKCSPITLKPQSPGFSMITQRGAQWADLIQRRANCLPSMSTLAEKDLIGGAEETLKNPQDDPPPHHHEEGPNKTDPNMQQTIRMSTLAEKVPIHAAETISKQVKDDDPQHHYDQNENDSK